MLVAQSWHCSNPRPERFRVRCAPAAPLPPPGAVRGYIENAIDIVVQIDRLTDGRRKISSICEVSDIIDGKVNIKPIFSFNQRGLTDDNMVEGEFKLNRGVPKVYDKIKRKGIDRLDDMFKK